MDPNNPQTPQQDQQQTTPIPPVVPQVFSEPRNLLAAMLLTITIGPWGLHQLYLGRKTQAWIRFALSFVAVIPFIGFIVGIVLSVWAFVDFIRVYTVHTDGNGQPLVATKRDAFVAKLLFILTLILVGIVVLGMVVGLIIAVFSGTQNRAAQA